MNIQIEDLEQEIITERNPQEVLLQASTEILEHRMSTASSQRYKNILEKEIYEIENNPNLCFSHAGFELSGIFGESLFFIACQKTGIPITISTGDEDLSGTDFHVLDIPVDVTTARDSKILSEKVGKDQAQLLCVPHFLRQRHIVHTADTPKQMEMFLSGNFMYEEYFNSLICINKELHYMMQSYLIDHTENEYKINFKDINSKKAYRLGNLIFLISRRLKQFQQ